MASRRLLLLVFLAVAVFAGLVGYGDFPAMTGLLLNFPLSYLLTALALAFLNYLLRFLRWAYYLRTLKVNIPWPTSILVFLSGLAMSVTPGKVGEVLKSYMLRDRQGVPVAASAPAVVMERLTDVVAVVALGLTGLAILPLPISVALAVALLLCAGVFLFAAWRNTDVLIRIPLLRRWERELQVSREGFRLLVQPRHVVVAVVLGVLAWLSEGVALWVVLLGLGVEVNLLWALPIYAAATLVGALIALPGGLIGTEGTMVALLQQTGLDRGVAAAATLLVRVATLWLAVLIGLAALAILHRSASAPDAAANPRESDAAPADAPF
jgi:uncharacterized protein (TIRG00374 family)